MNQWGPLWHMLQFQRISVVSDLIILNACSHFPGRAMACVWVGSDGIVVGGMSFHRTDKSHGA